jgi:hypothetical protein
MTIPDRQVDQKSTIELFLIFGLMFAVAARTNPESVHLEEAGVVSTLGGLGLLLSDRCR